MLYHFCVGNEGILFRNSFASTVVCLLCKLLKVNLSCPTTAIANKSFPQLVSTSATHIIDNSLYVIYTKWFVLITEFLVGHHGLEMWCSCIICSAGPPLVHCYYFLSRVETATTVHVLI